MSSSADDEDETGADDDEGKSGDDIEDMIDCVDIKKCSHNSNGIITFEAKMKLIGSNVWKKTYPTALDLLNDGRGDDLCKYISKHPEKAAKVLAELSGTVHHEGTPGKTLKRVADEHEKKKRDNKNRVEAERKRKADEKKEKVSLATCNEQRIIVIGDLGLFSCLIVLMIELNAPSFSFFDLRRRR